MQIEEDRRKDIDTNNDARKQFDGREEEIKALETEQTEHNIRLSTLAVQSRQSKTELADLIRRRTELECLIRDVEQANLDGENSRENKEEELATIEERIERVREQLEQLGPELEEKTGQEKTLRQQ